MFVFAAYAPPASASSLFSVCVLMKAMVEFERHASASLLPIVLVGSVRIYLFWFASPFTNVFLSSESLLVHILGSIFTSKLFAAMWSHPPSFVILSSLIALFIPEGLKVRLSLIL